MISKIDPGRPRVHRWVAGQRSKVTPFCALSLPRVDAAVDPSVSSAAWWPPPLSPAFCRKCSTDHRHRALWGRCFSAFSSNQLVVFLKPSQLIKYSASWPLPPSQLMEPVTDGGNKDEAAHAAGVYPGTHTHSAPSTPPDGTVAVWTASFLSATVGGGGQRSHARGTASVGGRASVSHTHTRRTC